MATKKLSPEERSQLTAFLSGWNTMAKHMPELTEEQIARMLDIERHERRRFPIMLRLHQRYCKLRMERERKELFGE